MKALVFPCWVDLNNSCAAVQSAKIFVPIPERFPSLGNKHTRLDGLLSAIFFRLGSMLLLIWHGGLEESFFFFFSLAGADRMGFSGAPV